ncbi:MAG: hypothetical protein WDM86_08050 [Rhizomicrobium sp.]
MTHGTILRRAATIALALALTGCVFFESKRDRAMRNDPSFQAGYSDGCASANSRGTNYRGDKIRDEALYATSQPYRSGWGSGYSLCNNQYNRGSNPNTQDMPDQRPNP